MKLKFLRLLLFILTGCFVVIRSHGQSIEKERIERELLSKARQNIEQFRKGNASIKLTDSQDRPLKNVKVQINQLTQDFLFGNLSEEIFRLSGQDSVKFHQRFTELFNYTELTIKWAPYEPKQGRPEWELLQKKLDWCDQNNVTVKGHALGWTHMAGTPDWLLDLDVTYATELYKARIQNLVGGFRDQITIWDVVNEPVTTIPWERALMDKVGNQGKIDDGSRYNTAGITLEEVIPWVENSFRWSYQANEQGEFHLNEFYLIAKPEVRGKFCDLVKSLKQSNTPLSGIGIQAHEPREMWFSPIEVSETFDKLDELGLPLHITEFIPQSSGKKITGSWREGVWTEEAQAQFAEQFYTLAFGHPSMKSIHWWGLSDKMIWLAGGGLLDENFNPKPVYERLHRLIKEEWMTKNLIFQSDKKGMVNFRGFYGTYEIKVTLPDGSSKVFTTHLDEKLTNIWEYAM